MTKRPLLLLSFSIFLGVSCSSKLDYALRNSGDNRPELEAVIRHYSNDPEKRDAAVWLIENMPGHISVGGAYSDYMDELDSLLYVKPEDANLWDSTKQIEAKWHDSIKFVKDIETIDSTSLINNIDAAFEAWRNGQWAKHLEYQQFKEWLLPYKCFEGMPIFSWRDSLSNFCAGELDHLKECYEYSINPLAAISCVVSQLESANQKKVWGTAPGGHLILRPSTYLKYPRSTCENDCYITSMVVKSKGIPISIDFISQWPDKALNHTWCSFPSINGTTDVFDPFLSSPGSSYYPYSRYAKVLRWSYEPNQQYIKLLKNTSGKVPRIFKNPFFKDVTDEYCVTSDIRVRLRSNTLSFGETVYIAVFDNNYWTPVYWGKSRFGYGYFEKMGRRITYIVLNKDLKPVSDPFEIDALGAIHYMRGDENKMAEFRITRKYPLYSHVFKISSLLKGGIIEASDNPLFMHSDTVAVLPDWPLAASQAAISQTKPYRYWRLCMNEGEESDMDEVFFYEAKDSSPMSVSCVASSSEDFSNMFDGNTLTNYHVKGTRFDGAVDFGRPQKLDHVSFLRRGDGNVIFPGDVYRIYYWKDGEWVLFSETKARDIYLDIKGIPAGALYYIVDISSGFQNRIFTVDEITKDIVWH